MRIGTGYDVHRLEEGYRLIIGGVEIPYEKGLKGHSDADVLVHAVMDALLGAAALGDIGKLFPDTDEKCFPKTASGLRTSTRPSLRRLRRCGRILIRCGRIWQIRWALIFHRYPSKRRRRSIWALREEARAFPHRQLRFFPENKKNRGSHYGNPDL